MCIGHFQSRIKVQPTEIVTLATILNPAKAYSFPLSLLTSVSSTNINKITY